LATQRYLKHNLLRLKINVLPIALIVCIYYLGV
jgi:hypothetical protein